MRALLLCLVLLLAAPAAAGAAPLTIRTGERSVTRIGPFRPAADPTIAAAERAFGPASSRRLVGEGCRVDWRGLRLRMYFANFGSVPRERTACSPRVGRAQTFTVRGPALRTWRGLRVGQPSATIPQRHPNAVFRDGIWWLRTAPDGYAVLKATVGAGRVRSIGGWIGGAGD